MDHTTSDLLPCPFCGAPAAKRWAMISCTVCPAHMEDQHADEAAHVAAWNRRAALASALEKEAPASGGGTPRTDAVLAGFDGSNNIPIHAMTALARQLERELAEDCEDCDHGIRGGKVCESCNGSGRVTFKALYEATARHVKELKPRAEALTLANAELVERCAKVCDDEERFRQNEYAEWQARVNTGNSDEPTASIIYGRIQQSRFLACAIRALSPNPPPAPRQRADGAGEVHIGNYRSQPR